MRRPLALLNKVELVRSGSRLLGLACHGGVEPSDGECNNTGIAVCGNRLAWLKEEGCRQNVVMFNLQPWLVGVAGLVEFLDGTVVTGGAFGRVGAPEADLSTLGADTGDGAQGSADGGSSADHCDYVLTVFVFVLFGMALVTLALV